MATCSSCGTTTTKCGCKDTPLTTPPSYTCPPSDSCPDPTPCFETIQDTCVIHSLNYGLPCLGVTAGMTLEQILQLINNTLNSIGDATLSTSDEGVLVENSTTAMNFVGPLVNAVSAGANSITVNVNGDLVADLDDVNQNGFSSLANLAAGSTFDFLATPPTAATYIDWINDIGVNRSNGTLTYALVYDPVTAVWRPFNIAFLVNDLIENIYVSDGTLTANRTVNLDDKNLKFLTTTGATFNSLWLELNSSATATSNYIRINGHRLRPLETADSDIQLGYYHALSAIESKNSIKWFPRDTTNGGTESARITREGGVNGTLEIANDGTGGLRLQSGTLIGTSNELVLNSDGSVRISEYGIGNFAASPVYMLGVNASGDLLEVNGSSVQQSLITQIEQVANNTYSLSTADAGKLIKFTNAGAITVNVFQFAVVQIPIGTRIEFYQANTGVVTINPLPGVTVNSRGGLLNSNGQYAKFELIKTGTDEWLASGDLV